MSELVCLHRWGAVVEGSEVKLRDGRPVVTLKYFKSCHGLCRVTVETGDPDPRVVVGYLE
jgi:hypothetical protein